MAKFFLVLSIIASIAAGTFGYLSMQQTVKVQSTLTDTKNTLAKTKAELVTTKGILEDTKTKLADTQTKLDAKTAEALTLQGKIDELNKTLADTQAQLATAQASIADLQEQIKKLTQVPEGPNGPGKTAAEMIKDLQAQLAEKDLVLKQAQQAKDAAEARSKDLADKIAAHDTRLNQQGLEGQVLAVNQGWNFAVISIGDKQGAVPNALVLVKRGETLIAKLKVTTVEPTTSIADIQVETLAKGQRVMPGDRVIFTGQASGGPIMQQPASQPGMPQR